MEQQSLTTSTSLLVCQECGRLWLDPRERWRLYVDPDEVDCTVPYCEICAEREFGRN